MGGVIRWEEPDGLLRLVVLGAVSEAWWKPDPKADEPDQGFFGLVVGGVPRVRPCGRRDGEVLLALVENHARGD